MTTTTEPDPVAALRNVRASRPASGRRPVRKTAAPRKAPVSRAENAARRGKYADRIVGAIKTGCAVLGVRAPVQAKIIEATAEDWGAALDRVAAEDKRVDVFLSRVSGWFGKSSAWGDLGAVAAKTGAALAMSAGMTPGGPVGMAVVFLGGSLVEAGIRSVAEQQAPEQARRHGLDPDDPANALNLRVIADQLANEMIAQMHDRSRVPEQGPDDPAPATAVPDPGVWQ